MRQRLVMGNWKMNGRTHELIALLKGILENTLSATQVGCAVFPPAIYIPLAKEYLTQSPIKWGAQNVYPKDAGAFTGELAGPMLSDLGCHYVLVGHSERRHLFHEDEKFIAEKFHHVKLHDMIPVLCVGETLDEREKGLTEAVIKRQLAAVHENHPGAFQHCIVAYEPVWAIGTGKTATPEQAQEVHQFIRSYIAAVDSQDADRLSIIYGGSVNEKNARALFAMPDVDGGLVGNASLNAQQFLEIIKCIN